MVVYPLTRHSELSFAIEVDFRVLFILQDLETIWLYNRYVLVI